MSVRIFDEDPEAGLTRLWHYDDDTATIETSQDVGDLVETNKKIHNEFDGGRARWPGDWHRVASILLSVTHSCGQMEPSGVPRVPDKAL